MKDRKNTSTGTPNPPHDARVNRKELDAMSAVDLAEELEQLWGNMDEDTYDEELIDAYLDALDRKAPLPDHPDAETAYKLFLERTGIKEQKAEKRHIRRGLTKAAIAAAVVVAVLVGAMLTAQAAGFDIFARIARWTAETFGFELSGQTKNAEPDIPPQLEGMKEALLEASVSIDYLPAYWPEGYGQTQLETVCDSDSITVYGAYGEHGEWIILTYTVFSPKEPTMQYNIDDDKPELYIHNGINFYIMTNEGTYLAAWSYETMECAISGVSSYEELIKILDSIGG